MDTDHVLEAHFEAGQAVHTFEARTNLPDIHLRIAPTGTSAGTYPTGTDLVVEQVMDVPGAPGYDPIHAPLGWKVNGRWAGFEPRLSVRLIEDTRVEGVFGPREHTFRYHAVPDTEVDNLHLYSYADESTHFVETFADGQRLNLTTTGPFEHWRVNGVVRKELPHALTIFVREALLIEACFKGWDAALKLTVSCNIPIFPEVRWGRDESASSENLQRVHEFLKESVFHLPKGTSIDVGLPRQHTHQGYGDLESVTINQVYVPLESMDKPYRFTLEKDSVVHFEYKPR